MHVLSYLMLQNKLPPRLWIRILGASSLVVLILISHEIAVKISADIQLSEGLMGTGGNVSMSSSLIRLAIWTGCGCEVSVPPHVGLSTGLLLSVLKAGQLDSSKMRDPRDQG